MNTASTANEVDILYCNYSYHTELIVAQSTADFPCYLLRLQTEGRCTADINGISYEIKQGDLLLMKPEDVYKLTYGELPPDKGDRGSLTSASGDYYLICDGQWITEWWQRSSKPMLSRIDLDEKLLALWQQIIIEHRRTALGENKELISYLFRALCLYLERLIKEFSPSSGKPYKAIRMKRYVEEHAMKIFTVEEAARHAELSVSRAVQLFKSTFGKTMLEYAHEIRLSTAVERMKYTSMTLEQIAESCGFGNYSYFFKVFKRKYGISPGVYRRIKK